MRPDGRKGPHNMNPAAIAQLAIILAPIAENIVAEGEKIIANYRKDLTQEQIDKSLELSKSASWPAFDFAQAPAQIAI
jgi:hypothetical protein